MVQGLIVKNLKTSFKISKTTMLIPLFVLSMHSSAETREAGIVKDKIGNRVFLASVNNTCDICRVIDFTNARYDRQTRNIYLNMNKGDTVLYFNEMGTVEIKASWYQTRISGRGYIHYNVISINGVHRDSLPDMVQKQKQDAEIEKLRELYNNLQNSR